MSSVPPTTPPGGAPPPPFTPYDPKAYREQQKAAWRAQRAAWKAQRHTQAQAWKANCANIYGPRVPSVVGPIILIATGVVALLLLTGYINQGAFWNWYGRFWPLLLIGAGLALLAEWALDLHRKAPVRRGGSFVGIILVLALLGVYAAEWNHAKPWFTKQGVEFGLNDDFFNALGLPEHGFDLPALSQQIPANAAIEIQNPRGDVSVTAGDGSTIEVLAHEVAYAGSDAEARKIFDAETPRLTVNGSAVLVRSESNSSGRLNLAVTVPRGAKVTVESGKGNLTATDLGAGISVIAGGDVHLSTMSGPVQAHFASGDHDFSAHDIQGSLSVDGDLNSLNFSAIKGPVTQNGEILGDAHLEAISGPVHLHTSVTSLDVAELPGDLTLSSDELRVNQAKGLVRVATRSKDIDLNQIYGDCAVEDRDGDISIEPAGAYAVEAKNSKGDVELTLPPNASATVNARTHNGDIVSDYAIQPTQGEDKSVTFRVGSGSFLIALSADNGDVRIKKGPAFPSASWLNTPPQRRAPMTNPPATRHRTSSLSSAPRLKMHKELPAQPVTQ
jgi:DUF4097 and DUF4098 domain-containing protein YvlB